MGVLHRCHTGSIFTQCFTSNSDTTVLHAVLPLGSVSSTSDCHLFQHQITLDFYFTRLYKQNQWSVKFQRLKTPKSNFHQSVVYTPFQQFNNKKISETKQNLWRNIHWSNEEKGQCKGCITFITTNFLLDLCTVLQDC